MQLWFDVGVKRYTTCSVGISDICQLWFDVGVKRYTTPHLPFRLADGLWFDVGVKRYTTRLDEGSNRRGCGLMQESKDIQPVTGDI